MKNFTKQAAQGDMLITKIDQAPLDATLTRPEKGVYILAHSETGHHHVISADHAKVYAAANDPFIAFMIVEHPSTLTHLRSFDTHAPITIAPGTYQINRQREYTPEGFRRAAD